MWALAAMVRHLERDRWRELMGTEFTGFHEGRRVRLMWHERTVGHVCRGDNADGAHLKCMRLVEPAWVFVRSARGAH